MRRSLPVSLIGREHPDFEILSVLEDDILRCSGGLPRLRDFFAEMLREEIDKLIDTPNTDRREYAELEKVEKTHVGTRVEIRLRKFWGYPKGRLDLRIGHLDVDIKHTMEASWMIPVEAVGAPCVLTAADENTALCYMGLILAKNEYLTGGANRDRKVQVAAAARKHIRWLIPGQPYPPNFWKTLDLSTVGEIFEGKSGMERVRRLFRNVLDRPVPRKVVIDAAQQLDPIKRVRKNSGARDQMLREGILILSGDYHAALIAALMLPACKPGEFIAHRLKDESERALARAFDAL